MGSLEPHPLTSVGSAAAAIAKVHGAHVAATTSRRERTGLLRENGADHVIVVDGAIHEKHPAQFGKVLELRA